MRILLVGSGAREHALAWRLAQCHSVSQVVCPNGNPGIARVAKAPRVALPTWSAWTSYAESGEFDLAVIGPEAPLAAGLADDFRAVGIPVFGPGAEGARIESSKAFLKRLLIDSGIPTASGAEFRDAAAARGYARALGLPVVVKADGLAAGKGVTVATTWEEADAAIEENLVRRRFGAASESIVVEECLLGEEVSVIALCDGERLFMLPPVEDYKRAHDGDAGPNTGGMGTFAPTPLLGAAGLADVEAHIMRPLLSALRARGIDYRGALFAGLMLTHDGPKVLEFNARFGDPETQVLMPLIEGDFAAMLLACARGDLSKAVRPAIRREVAMCVVVASGGYPGDFATGVPISGLGDLPSVDESFIFHAGTALDASGAVVTAGGRVLSIAARGERMADCRARIHAIAEAISFEGMFRRHDIGFRGERVVAATRRHVS